MARQYTRDELIAFVNRADTWEKLYTAREFIRRITLTPELRKELEGELLCQGDCIGYDSVFPAGGDTVRDEDRGYYSPSAPWNAPGMRVSDFITGVRYF